MHKENRFLTLFRKNMHKENRFLNLAKLTICGDTGIGSGFSQRHIIFAGWNGIFVFLGFHRLSHNPKYMVNKNKLFPVTEFGFPFALGS